MKPSGQEKIQHSAGQKSDSANCQELEKANLVINQFIKSCSHSMRSPLKSIRGLVNILKERSSDTGVDPVIVLKFIEESTDKMETMLDELEQFMLNSSKETNSKSIDLEELIFRVTTGFQKEIKKENINLTVQVEQSGPFYSDPGRIGMILNHVLMNALTFQKTENPDKRVRITCCVDAEKCVLDVEDNGIGIEADQHQNIFKIFYQATGNPNGSGIGLFVVREALDKMGGTLTLHSQSGQGSLFTFSFPNQGLKVTKR